MSDNNEKKSLMDTLDEMPDPLGALLFAVIVVGGSIAIVTAIFTIAMIIGGLLNALL